MLEKQLWLQSFFGLNYLSSNEVNYGFISFIVIVPSNVEYFTDFIVDPILLMKIVYSPHF